MHILVDRELRCQERLEGYSYKAVYNYKRNTIIAKKTSSVIKIKFIYFMYLEHKNNIESVLIWQH
jgi:hypothetical protein